MAEAGKGSKQRPTDQESYSSNWDKIFGKSAINLIAQDLEQYSLDIIKLTNQKDKNDE